MGLTDLTKAARKLAQYWPMVRHRANIENDRSFVVWHSTTLAGGETTSIRLGNPEGSGVTVDIADVSQYGDFAGTFRMIDDFTSEPTGGTAAVEHAGLISDDADGTQTQSTIVDIEPTYTAAADPHFEMPLGAIANGSIATPGYSAEAQPLLEPGRDLVYEFTCNSGNSGRAWITVVFDELDYVPSQSSVTPMP